jgi:hypothetical protein
MKNVLKDMSDEDLVQLFAENCIEQDQAIFKEEVSKFKKIFGVMFDIEKELKSRGPEARLTLLKLYDHPNIQVRLQAAGATLAVAPVEARRLIEAISKSGWMPQAADAKGTLRNLDSGFFKPT